MRSDAAWPATTKDAGLGWATFSGSDIRSFKTSEKWVSSALTAEGLALREAVRSCANLGLTTVAFEADSTQLIKAVNMEECPTELYGVLSDIFSYVSAFDFVSFSWIPRERNSLADTLAKNALNVAGILVVGETFMAAN